MSDRERRRSRNLLLEASAVIMLSPVKGKAACKVYEFANLDTDVGRLDDYSVTGTSRACSEKTCYQPPWSSGNPRKPHGLKY